MRQRPFDHLVLCVRDLEMAREVYSRLGFTLTPPGHHPWGTANSLVQLQGNFLELITVAEPAKISPPPAGSFSFGAFNANFLARREGMSMLVFRSDDARRDREDFLAQGLQTYAPFDFSRKAILPDGSEVTVGFSLAFVTEPRMPEAALFVCQQHAPRHFWRPEYQRHLNGAVAVTEAVMIAPEPEAFADFFGKLQGRRSIQTGDGALFVRTASDVISILTPVRFAERFPAAVGGNVLATPHFAAFRVACDLEAMEAVLRSSSMPSTRQGEAIHVAPKHAFGVAMEFVAA